MFAVFAAASAFSAERLAIATRSAFWAPRKPGSRRLLILATPRMPQRSLSMVGYPERSDVGYNGPCYVPTSHSPARAVGDGRRVARRRAVHDPRDHARPLGGDRAGWPGRRRVLSPPFRP